MVVDTTELGVTDDSEFGKGFMIVVVFLDDFYIYRENGLEIAFPLLDSGSGL
jgi:hypothetical protein